MTKPIVEQDIEDAALDILQNDLGYDYVYGPDIAPDSQTPLRSKWGDVILTEKLRIRFKYNKIRNKKFSEMLEEAIKRKK